MFKGLGNITSLLRHAQNIGPRLQEMTEELKQKRVTGRSGGDMIQVEANGLGEILKITIDPDLMKRDEWEMVVDLMPAAVNDAIAKSKQLHMEAMQSLTGGVDLPGLSDALKQLGDSTNTDR